MQQSTTKLQYEATCNINDTATMTTTNKVDDSNVKCNNDVAM